MPTYINPQAWSTTAASNDGADSGFGTIADTSYPRPVLEWYRGDMAALKRYARDVGGALVAGGSANALTVTTHQNLSAAHVAAGMFLVVRAAEANTSATVTFSPDGLTAANVKQSDGSALAIGQIKAGMPLMLAYNSGSSEWRCVNLIAGSSSDLGSETASFLAIKPGAGQSTYPLTTPVKITFPIAIFNNGSLYSASNSIWTPPARKVFITSSVTCINLSTICVIVLHLYKNGASYKTTTLEPVDAAGASSDLTATLSVVDDASGADTYEIYTQRSVPNSSSADTEGNLATWFCGTVI